MNRIANLWDDLVSWENLMLAWRRARKGKKTRPEISGFELELEKNLFTLQQSLIDGSYTPGKYREFTIYERKPRQIAAVPFVDRIVHHALLNLIEPPLDKRFIFDSWACRKAKGVHAAVDRYQAYARRYSYVLKLDVSRYFYSIDHLVLKQVLRARIKDPRCLDLLDVVIDSSPEPKNHGFMFTGDDLLTECERRRGIPIGNLTSQFFANLYLDDFDHWLKQELKVPAYIRYVDDLFILADDKQVLWKYRKAIDEKLAQIRLVLNPNKVQILRTSEKVDVLGYRISRTRRWLRNDNGYRFQRHFRKMARQLERGNITWAQFHASARAWIGHARNAETLKLRESIFDQTALFAGTGQGAASA